MSARSSQSSRKPEWPNRLVMYCRVPWASGQDVGKAVGNFSGAQTFFDDFGDTFLCADARPAGLCEEPGRCASTLSSEARALLHRWVTTLRSRFLAQPHERCAHQHLQTTDRAPPPVDCPTRRIDSISALPSPRCRRVLRVPPRPIAGGWRRASSDSSPIHDAYFIKISFTVFSSPRRNIPSRKVRHFPWRHAPGLV